jgi:hypothetical protein
MKYVDEKLPLPVIVLCTEYKESSRLRHHFRLLTEAIYMKNFISRFPPPQFERRFFMVSSLVCLSLCMGVRTYVRMYVCMYVRLASV